MHHMLTSVFLHVNKGVHTCQELWRLRGGRGRVHRGSARSSAPPAGLCSRPWRLRWGRGSRELHYGKQHIFIQIFSSEHFIRVESGFKNGKYQKKKRAQWRRTSKGMKWTNLKSLFEVMLIICFKRYFQMKIELIRYAEDKMNILSVG